MNTDVIIPSYNRSTYLKRAIESILRQSHQDFNLYVVDDGSTDDTPQMMQQYSTHPKIHYLRQENKGVSAARNFAIRNSQSPWISFLDSDDEWHPHKLETQIHFLLKNPQYHFVHSNEIWVRNGKRVNPKVKFDKSNQDIFKRSLEMCLISPSTVMMRRDLGEKYGFFNENFIICEDYDLWLKIIAHEEIGFISEHLITKYGGHEDQLSTKYPAMDYWRIRSMVNLLTSYQLEKEQKEMVLTEINKKVPILLHGYLKHHNHKGHSELLALLGQVNSLKQQQ